MRRFMRKDLAHFNNYVVEEGSYQHKLDANESPYALPQAVRERIISWLENEENLNIYPDTNCTALRQALAELHDVNAENIICGVGSDQIIDYCTKAFLDEGDTVIVPDPSFSMYCITTVINHGLARAIPLRQNGEEGQYSYDMQEVAQQAREYDAKIVFLCSPNNPTGNSLGMDAIETLLKSVKAPVVVDEAYGEFSQESVIPLVKRYPNLMVLRTFSKAYGLAGARIGYAIADKSFIEVVDLVRPPYNVGTLSQVAALAALSERPLYTKRVAELNAERERVLQRLGALKGYDVYPSDANFIYIETKTDIFDYLKQHNVIIRRFDGKEDLYSYRLTIGTPFTNDVVIGLFEAFNRVKQR